MNYEKLVEEDTFLVVMSVRSLHCSCALGKLYQCSFPENPKRSSETLELIHSDLLELPTLLYSKYKWVITFLDDYSSYCRVAFLHKKSDAAEAIKAVFQLWSNTTSHSVKCLHTDNRGEYITSELQSFLCEQGIVHETSTSAKWSNRMVELDTARKSAIYVT